MSLHDSALIAHLLGVIFWIGGTVVAATIAATGVDDAKTLAAARKAILMWATPGMLLAWAGGLTMLIPDFGTLYARAGWMHGKLTFLVVLTALTGVITGRVRKAATGEKPATAGLLDGLAWGLTAGAMVVLVLAVLKPF